MDGAEVARLRTAGWIVAIFACALGLTLPGSARAAETYIFNAQLSLTGNCSESSTDPVPDPGCPGGTHPPAPFAKPKDVATDSYGDIYVASAGSSSDRSDARVDVFDSAGNFLTEVSTPGVLAIAVDTNGTLYTLSKPRGSFRSLKRYVPSVYEPTLHDIAYGSSPVVVRAGEGNYGLAEGEGLAVDPSTNHVYVFWIYEAAPTNGRPAVAEFGSATEGNPILSEAIGAGLLEEDKFLAIGPHHDVYASNAAGPEAPSVVDVFSGEEAGHPLKRVIDGSTTPAGAFGSKGADSVAVAVDQSTGHVFVGDLATAGTTKPVYEFAEDGSYISTITHKFEYVIFEQIAVDNGTHSPNRGYLFVPSSEKNPGHVFAFEPKPEPKPPVIESTGFDGATQTEAVLRAKINTKGLTADYRLEYLTQQEFETGGFAGANIAGEGTLGAVNAPQAISTPLAGLTAGTAYRFRVVVEDVCEPGGCTDVEGGVFATFPAAGESGACGNQTLRTGSSAALPDCRAYELVTPADTGGHLPVSVGSAGVFSQFGTPTATADGENVSFAALGGVIPGLGGIGALGGTGYIASRGTGGWQTRLAGPTAAQASNGGPGGLSPEYRYATTTAEESGSLTSEATKAVGYVRYPDGSFQLVARGSLGSEPRGTVNLISPGGRHIVFEEEGVESTPVVPLEPDAPPAGTKAIYDRTSDEVTHVVSLLPGEVTPGAGEDADFEGASADGSAVAFKLGHRPLQEPLYVRVDDSSTLLVTASPNASAVGFSANGRYLFYDREGNLFRFDTSTEDTVQINSSGDATTVNVPAGGTAIYFVSPSVLTGEANPSGDTPQAGKPNLYLWSAGTPRFVGTVTSRDVEGEISLAGPKTDGLGLWQSVMKRSALASDPSRATADGNVLLFESRAQLTSYDPKEHAADPEGHAEVYRFDASEGELTCLSCDPTLAAATGDASLLSIGYSWFSTEPATQYSLVPNLSSNGRRAYFQTATPLVPADNNGALDVYQWEASGEGTCGRAGGCVSLISTGRSPRPSYLYGVSEGGRDVFISTTDLLVGADSDATPSIYDARVEGGFPEPEPPAPCQGEGCRGQLTPPPSLPAPASPAGGGSGNAEPVAACPKGKHRVKSHGETRCVKNAKKHGHGGSKRKGHGK